MVRVSLKGVHRVRSLTGKEYHYAWRGGPILRGDPGSPEYVTSYYEAHQSLAAPDPSRFRSLVAQYQAERLPALAQSTQRAWRPWLSEIGTYFGKLSLSQFERADKIRPIIISWRNNWKTKPRTADYAIQVLSAVLSFAVDEGRLLNNPAKGISSLYSVDRSERIWTEGEIAQLKATCPPEIAQAFDLAIHTGLREGDLVRLCWSHIVENSITLATGKSRGKIEAIIPIYDALRDVLAGIPRRAPQILTDARGVPWQANRFSSAFVRARKAAGIADLTFHNTRTTAATRLYTADIQVRVIAEMLGWEHESVEKILRRYVGRNAATKALIERLNRK